MKKILILIGLISSIYAGNTKCQAPVCVYVYKGAMSGELIIVNNTQKTAQVNTTVHLDSKSQGFPNLILRPQSEMTLLKVNYDDHLGAPRGGALWLQYKFLEDNEPKENIKTMSSAEERKSKIKIEMH